MGSRAFSSRSRRGEDTRRRILDSAAHCFSEAGFRRTRFEEIAAGAGVSRTLVYAYFDSKENLLRAVRDRALEGWRAAVEPRIREAESARDALGAMVRETLLYARTRPFLRAIISEDSRVVLLGQNQLSRTAIALWRDQLAGVLEQGVASGEFRQDLDIESTTDAIRAMQLGVIDRMHRRDNPVEVASEAHVEAAARILIEGVACR